MEAQPWGWQGMGVFPLLAPPTSSAVQLWKNTGEKFSFFPVQKGLLRHKFWKPGQRDDGGGKKPDCRWEEGREEGREEGQEEGREEGLEGQNVRMVLRPGLLEEDRLAELLFLFCFVLKNEMQRWAYFMKLDRLGD